MLKQLLQEEFTDMSKDLVKAYDAKGMRASGDFESSLRVEAKENSVTLFGNNYANQLQSGRRKGKFPPKNAIEKWISSKGITPTDISKESLVFLISRKISREGWKREGFGGVKLISEVITSQRLGSIIQKAADKQAEDFVAAAVEVLVKT